VIEGWERVASGWALFDDILNDPGIIWGDFAIVICGDGVKILDKRDLDGKKQASDPLHNLATHLLAYQLNQAAGSCVPTEPVYDDVTIEDIAIVAETLLVKYNFDGFGHDKLLKKHPDVQLANELATYLDEYNNGVFCGDGDE
jgi:hypothetical protein